MLKIVAVNLEKKILSKLMDKLDSIELINLEDVKNLSDTLIFTSLSENSVENCCEKNFPIFFYNDYNELLYSSTIELKKGSFLPEKVLDFDKFDIKNAISDVENKNLSIIRFLINSDNKEIDSSKTVISTFLNKIIDVSPEKLFQIGVVYRELLTNSIRHGNEYNKNELIFIEVFVYLNEKEVILKISDNKEFDLKSQVENVEMIDDLRTGQRGLFLIKHLTDEIISDKKKKIVKFIV